MITTLPDWMDVFVTLGPAMLWIAVLVSYLVLKIQTRKLNEKKAVFFILSSTFLLVAWMAFFVTFLTRELGNNLWIKGPAGDFKKLGSYSIWWKSELKNQLIQGKTFKKQIPESSVVYAYQGTNWFRITYNITNPESEITLAKSIGLGASDSYLPDAAQGLTLQSFGRNFTNLPALNEELRNHGIVISEVAR